MVAPSYSNGHCKVLSQNIFYDNMYNFHDVWLFEIEIGCTEIWTYSHGSLLMVICHMFV